MSVVITISRQLGSQGSYMATEAATLLGFRYLDREILQTAAAEAGYPDERMVEALSQQEEMPGLLARILEAMGRMAPVPVVPSATLREGQVYAEVVNAMLADQLLAERDRAAAADNYRELVRQVILNYAEAGNVMIAGRGGQVILRHRRNALHVRIYGSPAFRVRTLMARQGLPRDEAEDAVQRSDRERTRYLQRYFGVAWDDPKLYHLSINADDVSVSMGAHIITEAARWLAKAQVGD
jgi:cytidylate kinase